jgi:hypothetical protein
VLEVLCDECESALKFEEFEDTLRKEVLLTIGARWSGPSLRLFLAFLEVIAIRADPFSQLTRRGLGIAGNLHDDLRVLEAHRAATERALFRGHDGRFDPQPPR